MIRLYLHQFDGGLGVFATCQRIKHQLGEL